jgi:hypothetical protein
VECVVRDRDFSQKMVYRCELCDRWFCEKHIKPRLAFIRNFQAVNYSSKVRALYYTEMQYTDGHPDFEYSRRKFREIEVEEKKLNELIKQALDRMNHYYTDALIPEKPIDVKADRKKRVEMLQKEEAEIDKPEIADTTVTSENKYGHRFVVPLEVYSNAEYREYLNKAQTMKSVKVIVDEYYRKYPFSYSRRVAEYSKRKDSEKSEKKKHWWQ